MRILDMLHNFETLTNEHENFGNTMPFHTFIDFRYFSFSIANKKKCHPDTIIDTPSSPQNIKHSIT